MRLPGGGVASIFNTVPSEPITALADGLAPTCPEVICCGDDAAAKQLTMRLARDAGFDPVDAGLLQVARYIEPFGRLIAQLAYEQETYGGPEAGYRFVSGVRHGA